MSNDSTANTALPSRVGNSSHRASDRPGDESAVRTARSWPAIIGFILAGVAEDFLRDQPSVGHCADDSTR